MSRARRVYHEWEDIPTQPDYKLATAFEATNPKYDPNAFTFEDVVTNEWFGVTVAGVVLGLLVARWWWPKKTTTATRGNPYLTGMDVLSVS